MKNVLWHSAAAAFMLVGSFLAPAAPANFIVDPPQITNDYIGKITLTLTTSLTNVGSVLVERYADLNTNGLVDAGEPLTQCFTVRDGELPFMGTNRIRNLNVPGDEDGATNGQMRIELFYPGVEPWCDRIEGHYVYRISSTNGFTATNQPFTIWQKWWPQGLRIYATNTSGQPMTNATMLVTVGKSPLWGTILNSDGWYTLFTPPSNWTVACSQTGYVGPRGGSLLTVSSNLFVTSSVTLIAGSNVVSGRLCDATNGPGLGGVFVYASSTNNLLAFTYTRTNGDYTLNLTTNEWRIGSGQVALLDRVKPDTDLITNVTNNVSNLNLQVYKTEALIYGLVTDEQTNRMTNIVLEAEDEPANLFYCKGISYPTTGTNTYCIGVVAGTNWWVNPDEDYLPPGYFGNSTNVAIGSNQTRRVDFVLKKLDCHVQGYVLDESSNGVGNIKMGFRNAANNEWKSTQTDSSGYFSNGLYAAEWCIQLDMDDPNQRCLLWESLCFTIANGQTITTNYHVSHYTTHLRGGVTNESLQAITNINVSTGPPNGGPGWHGTRTDINGEFDLCVAGGTWNLNVNGDEATGLGYVAPQITLNVTDGMDINGISLLLRNTNACLQVVLKNESNAPIVGIRLSAWNDVGGTNYYTPWTPTATNGSVSLGVFPGQWQISFMCQDLPQGYLCPNNVSITIPGPNVTVTTNIVVQQYTSYLRGGVTNESHQAIANINVSTGPANGGRWHSTRTDTNGEFDLGVTGGTNGLNVDSTEAANLGYVAPQIRLNVTEGIDINGISLLLRNTNACLTVVLKDDVNTPIAGIRLSAWSNVGETNYGTPWVRTDPTGSVSLGVFPGQWCISFMCQDFDVQGYPCPNNVCITIPGPNVTVTTNIVVQSLTAHISGWTLDETGGQITNIALGARNNLDGTQFWTRSDSNASFNFHVYGGDWTLCLQADEAQQRGLLWSFTNVTVVNYQTISGVVVRGRHANAVVWGYVTNCITGRPLANLRLDVVINNFGNLYTGPVQTDGFGRYYMGVCDGYWSVGVSCEELQQRGYQCVDGTNVWISPGQSKMVNFCVWRSGTAPELGMPDRLSPSSLRLRFTTLSGSNYTPQYSLSLSNPASLSDWISMGTYLGDGGIRTIVDPNATNRYRFYRVIMR